MPNVMPGPLHGVDACAMSAGDVAAVLGTDAVTGLTDAQAAVRSAAVGRNVVDSLHRRSAIVMLADQFRDALVLLLLLAAMISGAVLGEVVDAIVILAIVVLNAALGFFQQERSESALSRLREMTAPLATVVRERRERRLPAAELVPGDVIMLRTGDRVPADARVIEAHHLEVGEAMLTGEAFPQLKAPDPVPRGALLADRPSMVHMGTTVLTGRGRALVTATGRFTAMGEIATLLAGKSQPTPLQREVATLGRIIGAGALVIVAGVFALGWLQGYPAGVMFLTAVALAVAAVPEGLPAVVTITLARGVQRLAGKRAIVRRLPAVETLGAASVICTDKTGTLTRNEIEVLRVFLWGLDGAPAGLPGEDIRVRRYAEVAALCNDAQPSDSGGDPIEIALLRSLTAIDVDPTAIRRGWPRVDEAAFDARRKVMSTLHRSGDSWLLAVKGAPEVVLRMCAEIQGAAGPEPLARDLRKEVEIQVESMAADGWRTLGLAYRTLTDSHPDARSAERDLTLVGVVGLSDHLRDEAAAAVATARAAGIRVVMITGDHAEAAGAVARSLGIAGPEQDVMRGERLSRMDVNELGQEAHRHAAYARVDPADKVKIVKAWQGRSELVAMTGDGVNDAPALQAADIGVAMGSGTDVSRDAAAIVLADDNFATLVDAIREGRGIFDNLRKVVRFLLTTNISEVLVMAVGFLGFGALGQPLLPVQLLWINLVTDGLPVLALSADSPNPGLMRRPPEKRRAMLDGPDVASLLWRACVLAAATVAALVYGYYGAGGTWPEVRTLVFTTLVTLQLTYAFMVRGSSPWRGSRNLFVASLASLAFQLAVVYTSTGNGLFYTVPLSLPDLTAIAVLNAAAMSVIALISVLSRLARRRR